MSHTAEDRAAAEDRPEMGSDVREHPELHGDAAESVGAGANDRPDHVPNPLYVYGHVDLRSMGDSPLVHQSPVFEQARALALNPDASLEDVADSGPNEGSQSMTANEPITVIDGEKNTKQGEDADRAEGALDKDQAPQQDAREGEHPSRSSGVKAAAKKAAAKATGHRDSAKDDNSK